MKKEVRKIVLTRAILVGFWGGIIWGTFFLIMYLFNMVEVDHIALLTMVVQDKWVNEWYAHLIVLFIFSIIAIIFAVFYYYLCRKMKSWVVGVFYGIAVWFLVYFLLPFMTSGFNSFIKFEMETHVALICNFILFGVFIGYTISYDYEHANRELEEQRNQGEYEI